MVQQVLLGSPPPTRGTPFHKFRKAEHSRITPAYAGNTGKTGDGTNPAWDHPRLRGEHVFDRDAMRTSAGSPPPTRGTPNRDNVIDLYIGITPAYAGNTSIYLI